MTKLWPYLDYPWWRWIKKLKQRRARKRLAKVKIIMRRPEGIAAAEPGQGDGDVTVKMDGITRKVRIHREPDAR